jgi:hypothetical protein
VPRQKRSRKETIAQRKERLKACGKWAAFVAKRRELYAQGPPTQEHKAEVRAKMWADPDFAPSDNELLRSDQGLPGKFRDGKLDKRNTRPPEDVDALDISEWPAEAKRLSKKQLYASVAWVGTHLDVPDAAKTCDPPTPFAVSMHRIYTQTDPLKLAFIEKFIAPYVPTRAEANQDTHADRAASVSRDTTDKYLAQLRALRSA